MLLLFTQQITPPATAGSPIGLLLTLTCVAVVPVPDSIAPNGFANTSTIGAPVLYKETTTATIQTAWNNYTVPLFRFIFGAITIDEDRLIAYEEKQTGRLGRVEVDITLDNSDGVLTAYLGTVLMPRHEALVLVGAKISGTAYRTRRHTLTILTIAPLNYKNVTSAIKLKCENNWDHFRKPAASNLAWTAATIGDVLDDIADQSDVQITRDASAFWAHELSTWQMPAGLPPQPVIADLVGDGQRTHAIACARFDPDGTWNVMGINTSPATDVALSVAANQYESDLSTHGDVGTRFQITGNASQETASADDLETLLGEQRIHIVNAYALASTHVHARLIQEAIEQRERYQRGILNIRPDPRIELWHVVTLTGVSGISDATQWRVTSIYFQYAPVAGTFEMQLGLRAVATDNTATIIPPLPVVNPPPVVEPPEVIPPGVYPKETTVVDDFDNYDGNDPTTHWTFSGGDWDLYTDLATDLDIEYALGQITVSADRFTAMREGYYSADNYFAGGVYLHEAGAAGLLCFAVDPDNAYEIKIDSDADTVTLIRWIDGNPFTLATHSQTIDVHTGYFVGLQRHGHHLRAYCKSTAEYTTRIFSAHSLAASVVDFTYLSGRIGFTSYGVNSRFFSARAGVTPARSHGEHSHTTKPHGHRHCTGSSWHDPTGNAERSGWDTETCSHTDLARRVKALIDDLKHDHLIHD